MTKKSNPYYNKTNTCDRCREKGKETKLIPHKNAFREYDKDRIWTGNWICKNCREVNYQLRTGIRKSSRTLGNLDPNSTNAKGDKFQKLTCLWRNVEDLNIKNYNYNSPIDHSKDYELGTIDTKGSYYLERHYQKKSYQWTFDFHNTRMHDFDNVICYCLNKEGIRVERVYIFPWAEVIQRSAIGIYEKPREIPWYEEYRVKDEDVIKKVNDIWSKIGIIN